MKVSKIQKQVLLVLAACFVKGIKSIDSVSLRELVEMKEKAKLDRSNFRKSCLTMVEHGLIQRREVNEEIQMNITPAGFDMALEIKEAAQ